MKKIKVLQILIIAAILLCTSMFSSVGTGDSAVAKTTSLNNEYVEFWSTWVTEKILKDRHTYEDVKQEPVIKVSAVKNEYENAQLIMTAKKNINAFTVEVTDLVHTQDNKSVISKDNVSVYLQHYQYVANGTEGNAMPKAGLYPDMLIPFDAASRFGLATISEGDNQGLYFNYYIPKTAIAGLYKGQINVTLDGNQFEVPVSLTVYDYQLSDEKTARAQFTLGNNSIQDGELDSTYGMMEKYYEFCSDYRISPSSLTPIAINIFGYEAWAEEVYKYIVQKKMFTVANIPTNSENVEGYQVVSKQSIKDGINALVNASIKYNTNLVQYAQLYNFWVDEPFYINYPERQVQLSSIVVTEAINECHQEASENAKLTGELKEEILQDILDFPNMFTNPFDKRYEDYIDAFIMKPDWLDTPEEREKIYSETGGDKNKRWMYTCNDPRYPYPTMHLDATVISTRSIGWMMADYDLSGYLGWMTTKYTTTIGSTSQTRYDTFFDSAYRDHSGALGDGLYIYPGKPFGIDGPIPSIRIEAFRDGIEEFELLNDIYDFYASKGYDADDVLQLLYKNMYQNAKLNETSIGFEYSRKALLQILANMDNDIGLMITNVEDNDDNYKIDFVAKTGKEIYHDGKVVSATRVAENGYNFYSLVLNKESYANFVLSCNDEVILSVYLGNKSIKFDLEDLLQDIGADNVAVKEIINYADNQVIKVVTTDNSTTNKYQDITISGATLSSLDENVKEIEFNIASESELRVRLLIKYVGDSRLFSLVDTDIAEEFNRVTFAINPTQTKRIEYITLRVGERGSENNTIYMSEWNIIGGGV